MPARKVMAMLSCEDLARSIAFYRDLLGGEESYRFPDDGEPAFVALRLGDSELGMGPVAAAPMHGRPQRPAMGHRIELCIYVNDVSDTAARARLRGDELVREPADMPWGERVAWLSDPDGNLVMLTEERQPAAGGS